MRRHDPGRDRRGRRGRACIIAALLVAAAAASPWLSGCAAAGASSSLSRTSLGGSSSSKISPDEVRSQVMSLSDTYTQTVLQSLTDLIADTKDPRKANWARGQRLATVTVSITNATGPNAVVGLLDMVVFATLKRAAIEEYWLPNLLGEEGRGVLDAHRRGEAEAWAAAGRVLSKAQLAQLTELIDRWRQQHPGQYFVAYTRFSDFDAYRNLSPDSPQAKVPGSLFSLFYVDPLAGLDPVARELRSYRALTERMTFIASRLPTLAAYQVDVAVTSATATPEVRTFVASTEKFAGATDRFVQVVADYPKLMSAELDAAVKKLADATALERHATIDQAAKAVAGERQAILREVEQQDGRIRGIIGDVNRLVERTEQAGASVNAATTQTVAATEQATRRTMDHAFVLALVLLLVLMLGLPAVLIGYHIANRRWVEPAAAARPLPKG